MVLILIYTIVEWGDQQYILVKDLMRKKTTSEIICENFKIPHETIFQDYKCTYKSSVTFFGRIYIGEEHFLFNSNMFGIVKKCNICVNNIVKMEESSDSSTLTIVEKGDDSNEIEYMFGNLKNNRAYQLMRAIWTGQKIGKDAFRPDEDEQTAQFNRVQQVDPKLLIDDGQVEANFFNQQTVQSEKQKIVQLILPCTVDQYYDFFLADNATVYNRKKHLQLRKSREIKVGEWKKSEQLDSEVRQISTYIKVKGVPFKTQAMMNQVWMVKRKEDEININIVTQMSDIPYAAYFNLEQYITISKQGDKKCRMNVLGSVVFNKSTYMKNTIITRTFGDVKQQYQFWIKNTNTFLDQIRKKKDAVGSQDGSRKGSDFEYEQSQPLSDKTIPMMPGMRPTQMVMNKKGKMSLQQKVDLLLKLVILLLLMNIGQIAFKFM